jgi:hypothetical protein
LEAEQDTVPMGLAADRGNPRLDAGWLTRILYSLGLLSLSIGALFQGGWVGLATGGGVIGWAGPLGFGAIVAGLLFRIYLVLRYRSALRARAPYLLGWILRLLGWVLMLAGVVGMAALFMVKPLTLWLLTSAGENGIGYFVVQLGAVGLSGLGWMGCLVFEVSRLIGRRPRHPEASKTVREKKQDLAVAAGAAALVIGLPSVLSLWRPEPCYGPTVVRCVAKVEGRVSGMAAVPFGAPVGLVTNVSDITFRRPDATNWTSTEDLAFSLLRAGHPVGTEPKPTVMVVVNAKMVDTGVSLGVTVTEDGRTASQFTTFFTKGVRLEPLPGGGQHLVVDLAKNVVSSGGQRYGKGGDTRFLMLDELYVQLRQSIGSPQEAGELRKRVNASPQLLSASHADPAARYTDARLAKNCEGKVKWTSGNAETALRPSPGAPLAWAVFVATPEPQVHALLHPNDAVICREESVWLINITPPDRSLQVRIYDLNGSLKRFLVATLPNKVQRSDLPNHDSFREVDGAIEFETLAIDVKSFKDGQLEKYRLNY